jgi:hypothetical protein
MVFATSPYFPFLRDLRRLIGDEESPVPGFSVTCTGPDSNCTLTVAYNTGTYAQTMTIASATGGSPAPIVVDLTQYTTLVDLLASIQVPLIYGPYTLRFTFVQNPLRNNDPTDLFPGVYALNAAPTTIIMRHVLSDYDLISELNGALAEHNPAYVIDPNQATATVVTNGQTTYPYPAPNAYPYAALSTPNLYVIPAHETYMLKLLAASYCLVSSAIKYARLPVIQTDGASIDRGMTVMRLQELATMYQEKYDDAIGKSGVTVQISDMTRISGTLGTLTGTPEYTNSQDGAIYGLRWLSGLAVNLIQPCTDDNAHPFMTELGPLNYPPGITRGADASAQGPV